MRVQKETWWGELAGRLLARVVEQDVGWNVDESPEWPTHLLSETPTPTQHPLPFPDPCPASEHRHKPCISFPAGVLQHLPTNYLLGRTPELPLLDCLAFASQILWWEQHLPGIERPRGVWGEWSGYTVQI